MRVIKFISDKLVKNLLFFGLSKGTAFIAPLLLLKFLTIDKYGIVEYSYSMGGVLAIVASLGFYGAYPYFILKKNEEYKKQSFLFLGFPILFLNVVATTVFILKLIDITAFLVYLFTVIFAMQRLLSAKFKTEDKGHLAVIIDTGYYFILGCLIAIVWIAQIKDSLIILTYTLTLYSFALSLYLISLFLKLRTFSMERIIKKEIKEIVGFSYKMILSGIIVFWLTSSSRIYINWFLGYENVGIYSFYFRMAGISVILYQFLAIAFFKKLYIIDTKRMDTYYSIIMVCIAISSGLCTVLIPYVANFLNTNIALDNWELYILLCFQMPIWVGFALCEAIIGREDLVNRFNITCGIIVLIFPCVLYLFKSSLTLTAYALFSCILFSFAFFAQTFILSKKQIVLKKCIGINCLFTLLAIISYIFY